MLSLSDNEFAVLNFLARNFTERLTIRTIAQKLKFSPAGVHTILKKLEKQGIVSGEKLGTGLFYRISFESKTAYHLAAAVLVGFFDYDENKKNSLRIFFGKSKAILLDNKNALFKNFLLMQLLEYITNIKAINNNIILYGIENYYEIIK